VRNAVFLTSDFSVAVVLLKKKVLFSKTTLTRNGFGVHDDVTHTRASQTAMLIPSGATARRVCGTTNAPSP